MSKNINDLLKQIKTAASAYDAIEVQHLSAKLVNYIQDNIAAHPKGMVKELAEAVRIFDRKHTEELCAKLVIYLYSSETPYPLSESKKILGSLRRKRYFDLLSSIADVLIQTGQDKPTIRRQYAQSLIDQGYISAALDVLQRLERHCLEIKDNTEWAEARGLIGRARKQIYMDAAAHQRAGTISYNISYNNAYNIASNMACKNLLLAISAYAGVYEESKQHIWHGINAVALLERAKTDKLDIDRKSFPKAKVIATDILKQISSKQKPDLWDEATAGEACLALKDYPQALDWIYRYTQDSAYADAFEYASTLRQFEEVWKLDEGNQDQAQILHLLREALLRQEGGRVEIDNLAQTLTTASALKADKNFEQILGKDRYKTFQWYCTGLDRAAGVAQILDRSGNGQGSGFLVRGSEVHQRFGEDWVVVTNAHVISDDPLEQSAAPASLPSDQARIRFEAIDPDQQYAVKEILFSSPRSELDCTILSLQSPVEHAKPYPIAKRLPLVDKNQRVYVIGHPRGGGLSYSIDDNLLLDHEKPRVHYRTPTEGGSSGSPVFNQQWDLIALHHAGGLNMKKLNNQPGYYPANEGLYFQSIRDAVAARLG
jgi:hypothetical protein